jgi:exonuclease III
MNNASPLRIALWNVQGIKSPSSQTLVRDLLTSLKIDVAALAETNLHKPLHPPWKNYPNACWAITSPARGTGAALLCTDPIRLISSKTSSDARLVEASIQVAPSHSTL